MAGDAPLLERLAGMTPVAASEVLELIERLREPQNDPVIGPLFGVDDEGEAVVNPLVPTVLQQFQDKPGLTLKSAMKVYRVFGELGTQVYADGALSKKHKELTALAVAVSQNCFD